MDTFTRSSACDNCNVKCLFANADEGSDAVNGTSYRREIRFNKGETVFKHGSFNTSVVFVKRGLLKQFMEGYHSNKNLIVRFYSPGDYLGLSEVFGRNEIKYTVTALNPCDVCLIEINQAKKILAKDQSLYEILFRHFNRENDFLYYRLGVMGTKNLQGRMAEAITYISQLEKKGLDIYPNITRKELAELAGMSVESMIRLLNEFKHDRLINIDGKILVINNMEMMKILCRVG